MSHIFNIMRSGKSELFRGQTAVVPNRPARRQRKIVGNEMEQTALEPTPNVRFRHVVPMHVPPGGGPPPHRHDTEESFTVLTGEIEATFRGKKSIVRAGETVNIPANAPHSFTNGSRQPARLLCICAPAGQDELFLAIGGR